MAFALGAMLGSAAGQTGQTGKNSGKGSGSDRAIDYGALAPYRKDRQTYTAPASAPSFTPAPRVGATLSTGPATPATAPKTPSLRDTGPVTGVGAPPVETAEQIAQREKAERENYLLGDSSYQAVLSALTSQLENYLTDANSQRERRALDFDESLRSLGANLSEDRSKVENWNFLDQMTASGRAYQNLINDFAARGMIRSTGAHDAQVNLSRSLEDQFQGLARHNTQFNTDLDTGINRAQSDFNMAKASAEAEAILRRAAQQGFGL